LDDNASDEQILNFAEQSSNRNLMMALISYVETLIEVDACEIAYNIRKAKYKKIKIEKSYTRARVHACVHICVYAHMRIYTCAYTYTGRGMHTRDLFYFFIVYNNCKAIEKLFYTFFNCYSIFFSNNKKVDFFIVYINIKQKQTEADNMKHPRNYGTRDGTKIYNTTNGDLIEKLIGAAILSILVLFMTGAALTLYKFSIKIVEDIQTTQTAQTIDLENIENIEIENVESIIAEFENIEN
jgi:hypothetical protein